MKKPKLKTTYQECNTCGNEFLMHPHQINRCPFCGKNNIYPQLHEVKLKYFEERDVYFSILTDEISQYKCKCFYNKKVYLKPRKDGKWGMFIDNDSIGSVTVKDGVIKNVKFYSYIFNKMFKEEMKEIANRYVGWRFTV